MLHHALDLCRARPCRIVASHSAKEPAESIRMKAFTDRFNYLFRSTKGLILVAIVLIAIVTAAFGMLSGPLKEWGISDIAIKLYGMKLVEAEREARIILLYHTIAMAVVAIETYLITALVRMKPSQQASINATITVGYITSLVFGLAFGYFGRNFVFHGLFITGQALVFFAGLQLAAALWPWRKEYHVTDPAYAHTRGGVDLERVAFFTMAAVMLISAIFGAVPGSLYGQGHETFLAEDIVRVPFKTPLQLAVIGHLHIMLELIAVALTLILSRWFDFEGKLHKWAMPLMIIGTLIVAGGVWAVVPFEPIAHMIINVGSLPTLIASALLVWFGWRKIAAARLAERDREGGIRPLARRAAARPGEVRHALADGLHERRGHRGGHLHGHPARRGDPHLVAAGRAGGPHRPLAHPLRDHRHDHPLAVRRPGRAERESAAVVRLGRAHCLGRRIRGRDALRDQAPVRHRGRPAAARGRHHDHQRRGVGDGADRPGRPDGLAADRSVPPQWALGEGGERDGLEDNAAEVER